MSSDSGARQFFVGWRDSLVTIFQVSLTVLVIGAAVMAVDIVLMGIL